LQKKFTQKILEGSRYLRSIRLIAKYLLLYETRIRRYRKYQNYLQLSETNTIEGFASFLEESLTSIIQRYSAAQLSQFARDTKLVQAHAFKRYKNTEDVYAFFEKLWISIE
jgi:hypothetical protein